MAHDHSHHRDSKTKLFITILLNLIITAAEVIGGLISGSLALLSDALHNLSDVFSLVISYFALVISRKKKDDVKTFGYKRVEVLAALLNIIILLVAVVFIVQEAVKRFFNPQPVIVPVMITITVIGLIGNALSIIIIFRDTKKSINIKSAFLHLLGDTISSVGVLIVAVILLINPDLYFLDPVISILIAAYIVKEGISIFLESLNILMQGVPKGIDPDLIITKLKENKKLGIIDIHHMHVWALTPEEIIMDCHIVIPEKDMGKINDKLKNINSILKKDFDISHTTIQFEHEGYTHSEECCL